MDGTRLVGSAASDLTKYADTPSLTLVRQTLAAALTDAGLDRSAVDGLAVTPPGLTAPPAPMFAARLGEHLGLELAALVCVENGGCSGTAALRRATMEVATGRCDVAVAVGIDQRHPGEPGEDQPLEAFLERRVFDSVGLYGPYHGAYGIGAPLPYYAMSAQRYIHETGATEEDLAWAAVRLREHANGNPAAVFHGTPLTVPEVLESEYLAPPLHLTDCSQFVSGAAAVVVASPTVAERLDGPAVTIRGWGQAHQPTAFTRGVDSLTRFPAVRRAAEEAYADADRTPAEIDVAEVYGVFSATELMLLEELGLFDRGEAGPAFRDGRATYGGDVVVDPSGGRLSLGHPALATPLLSTHELLTHLRGRAGDRQVTDATVGLLHAEHGMLNGSVVAVLEAGG